MADGRFTILREPLERMISEYAFLRDRPHFMERLEPRATSLREYLLHAHTRVCLPDSTKTADFVIVA